MTAGEDVSGVVDRPAIVADLSACRDDSCMTCWRRRPRPRCGRGRKGPGGATSSCCSTWCSGSWSCGAAAAVRVMSVLPPWVGRGFARLLDAGRAPFHWVNYAGSVGGALVFNHARMGRLCDHTIDHLVATLSERQPRLGRGRRPDQLGPVLPAVHDVGGRVRVPRAPLRAPPHATDPRRLNGDTRSLCPPGTAECRTTQVVNVGRASRLPEQLDRRTGHGWTRGQARRSGRSRRMHSACSLWFRFNPRYKVRPRNRT